MNKENKENLIPVKGLSPFKRFCMTIGELPASYLETMTYYEMLVWFTKYMQDTVIPTINNNASAVDELQNKYVEFTDNLLDRQTTFENNLTERQENYEEEVMTLFNNLQSFVNNYFENLDVQEEINNKLDQMAEDGILQEIIADYLNSKAIFGFNNVAEMKEATNLINGSYAKTLGYYNINDGGSGLYKIREITNSDVIDEGSIIAIGTGNLIAELVINNNTNVKQFGAKGDGENDDSQYFNKALNFLNIIKVPKGVYLLSNTIELSTTKNIKIIGEYGSIIKPNGCIAFSKNGGINEIEFINIEFDLSIALSNGISITNQVTTTGITNSLKVTDCKFISDEKRTNKKAIELIGGMNSVISNCEFDGVYGFYQKQAVNTTVNNSRFTRCSYCIYADSNGAEDAYSCGIKISDCFILASICGFKIVANDYFTLINTMIDYTTYPVSLIGQGLGVIDSCYLTSTDGNTVINIKNDTLSQNEYYSGNNTGEISQFIKITNCDLITHCEINNDTSNINQEAICLYVENSYNISIINNSFRFYTHYGIFFKDVSVVNVDNCRFAHNNLYPLTNEPYIIDGLKNNSVNNYDADRYIYSNLFNNQGDKFRRYVAQVINIDIPNVFRDRNYGSVSIPAGSLTATVNTGLYTPIKSLTLSCNNNVRAYYTGKGDISKFTIRLSDVQESNTEVSWLAIC